jgi:hypothetical protein
MAEAGLGTHESLHPRRQQPPAHARSPTAATRCRRPGGDAEAEGPAGAWICAARCEELTQVWAKGVPILLQQRLQAKGSNARCAGCGPLLSRLRCLAAAVSARPHTLAGSGVQRGSDAPVCGLTLPPRSRLCVLRPHSDVRFPPPLPFLSQAVRCITECLSVARALLVSWSPRLARAEALAIQVYLHASRYRDALSCSEANVVRLVERFGPGAVELAEEWGKLAHVACLAGQVRGSAPPWCDGARWPAP